MLQNITPAMLQELTLAEQERLREWWKPQAGDVVCLDFPDGVICSAIKRRNAAYPSRLVCFVGRKHIELMPPLDTPIGNKILKEEILPLLNVGQCIEFLGDKTWIEILGGIDSSNGPILWSVDSAEYSSENIPELIRALWDTVKACLKEACAGD
jgi:hypothetical protein